MEDHESVDESSSNDESSSFEEAFCLDCDNVFTISVEGVRQCGPCVINRINNLY